MLKEVRDDNRENDADHMKPVGRFGTAPIIPTKFEQNR
jgi:hypothetical protein